MSRTSKKRKFHWISNRLDNLAIKKKMYFLYLFCVVLPVVVTDSFIISIAVNTEKAEQKKSIESIGEAVKYNLVSGITNTVSITKDVFTNRYVSRFLDKQYTSALDYYGDFNDFNKNIILRSSFTGDIIDFTLFTDNDTILDGGNFMKISNIRNTNWYQFFTNSGLDVVIYPYYDLEKQYLYTLDKSRTLCIVRRLDFYGDKNIEKLVKVDLNYNAFQRDIVNTNYNAEVYVCYKDDIVFTNVTNNGGFHDFLLWSDQHISEENVDVEESVNLYGLEFKIKVVGYKSHVLRKLKDNVFLLLPLVIINLVLPITVIYLVNRSITHRILLLGMYLEKVKDEEYLEIKEVSSKDEIGALLRNYNLMVTKIKKLIQDVYKNKIEQQNLNLAKQQAELLALHSQINPHFMFNVLETIKMRSLIKKEAETANIIDKLAILMRRSVDWGNDTISVKEELEFVEAYLQLQKYRFGDKLSYKITVDDSLLSLKLPKLTIVTFVENACIHGIEGTSSVGWIFVSITKEENEVRIEIEDTGIGMSDKEVELMNQRIQSAAIEQLENSNSVGMLNVCIRLNLFSNHRIKIEVESEERVGTTITIRMPLDNE